MSATILLVDDEEGIRTVLGIALADSGYSVLTADSGEQGLQLFRQHRPAIVLSDIKMPGMDGIELLRCIKAESPDTEVIMITGHGDMDLAIKSLKLEATDFVTKPINDDVLEIALKRANERLRMRRQLRDYTENLEALVREKSARIIDLERLSAVGQAVEGLATALADLSAGSHGELGYLNELPCLVAVHNRHGAIVAVNRLYRERLGDRVGAPSGSAYANTPDSAASSCPVSRTLESGRGQRSRERLFGPGGEELMAMVYTAPIQSSTGAPELVLEIVADLSEMRRLQEALRTTQQRYQLLFDAVPCYITVQDRSLRIVASNRRFQLEFGKTDGEQTCHRAYKGRDAACDGCPVVKSFGDGEGHQAEMIVTSGAGEKRHLLIQTAPLLNASGQVGQVMEMATDISAVRQLQEHLSSLGLMIGSISHGIKGVLTGLDGGLYMLRSGLRHRRDTQVTEGLAVVQQMVDRVRSVVLDILRFAKARSLAWEPLDVARLAREIASVAEPRVKAKAAAFVLVLGEPAGEIEADATLVQSALLNLLENAAEACSEDGSDRKHQVIFRVQPEAERVRFDIEDNGAGMTPEIQARLFTLFFSSKGHAGTGLGLFIADRVVRQHGGSIGVHSTHGQGSIFTVWLPRRLSAQAKQTEPASPLTLCA
jgi:signal transduction histidine kinase/FixJ family two-component response regulator